MRVVTGQYNLNEIDEEERVFDIDDTRVHPDWDSPKLGKYSNDIALIKISKKGDGSGFQFSDNVLPACLPRKYQDPLDEGTNCVISGWGKTHRK